MQSGTVVRSLRGRDKGKLLVTTGEAGGQLLVCDGKEHPLERPKKKNPRHLLPTGQCLAEDDMRYNSRMRKALRGLAPEGSGVRNQEIQEGRDAYVEAGHD